MMFDRNAVDQKLAKLVADKHLAGVSVCVKGKDGTVFEGNYGYRDADFTVAVDSDTVFGIASMSKSITALALCILDVEGKLSIDDPVVKFFPEFSVPGAARDTVTLRHLCMHTAGIPPMEPLEWSIAMNSERRDSEWLRQMRRESPNQMNTIQQVIDYIAHCPYDTVGAPGENMSYSNEGYAILSYVVDMAAGEKLEDFCAKRIFAPLGMTRTVMDDDCSTAKKMAGGNITMLFQRDDGITQADDFWSILPPFRGCAMVKSTSRDMAAYYRCLALKGMHDGKQAIPAEAVELLIGAQYPENTYDYYCLGLNKFVRYGHVFCEHSGGLHGVSTKGALIRDLGLGFAVMCNQGDEDVDDIMWVLYSAILGLPLDTCFRRFMPVGRLFSDPEMLIGSFTGHEGVPEHLTITYENGVLRGKTSSRSFVLKYCGATRFLGFVDADAAEPCTRLEFLIRNGQSWGVRVGSRIFGRDH